MNNNNLIVRDYQLKVISDLYKQIALGHKKILLVAPTGAGKTIISTKIIDDAIAKNKKVLFLIHRDVLAEQTVKTLKKNGLECGLLTGRGKQNLAHNIQVASVQTLAGKRGVLLESEFIPDMIFYDESHLTSWSAVGKSLLEKGNDAIHIGLTATPWRLKETEGMGDLFTALIHTPLPYELMEMGFLIYPKYYILDAPKLERIITKKGSDGDFQVKILSVICNVPEVIEKMVCNWLEIAKGRKTICFAVDVSHAKSIANAFQEKGINAAAIYGGMSQKEVDRIYADLQNGLLDVVSSCQKLSEGFDLPSINCVLLARPTKSKALFFQQIGRGLRISPGKNDCLILDHADSIKRFGVIEDLRKVELIKGKIKPQVTNFCEICGRGIPDNMTICSKCAPAAGIANDKQILIAKLIELVIRRGQKREFDIYRELLIQAYVNKVSPGWAWYQFKEKIGRIPSDSWGIGAVFGASPSEENKAIYLEHLKLIAQKQNKNDIWIKKYFKMEFRELISKLSPEQMWNKAISLTPDNLVRIILSSNCSIIRFENNILTIQVENRHLTFLMGRQDAIVKGFSAAAGAEVKINLQATNP